MPITFISLDDNFTKYVNKNGKYDAITMRVEDYIPTKKTYYVSPANSLCFMDGGIDYALSRIVFPDIEKSVKKYVFDNGKKTLFRRPYLPIGSSIIFDVDSEKSLIVAPTMLQPQNVSNTKNAYYASMAILYNILVNRGEILEDIDILFTSMCCGYGKMSIEESYEQVDNAVNDYKNYIPEKITDNMILNEPNLLEQPKFYENMEFLDINPAEVVHH